MSGSDDREDRAAILKRRAMFVVSAVAGIGLVACGDEPAPRTCLNVSEPERSTERPQLATSRPDPSAEPRPCLNISTAEVPVPADAGAPDAAPADAGAGDAGASASPDAGTDDAGTKPPPVPQPCLRVAPKPCLKVAPKP